MIKKRKTKIKLIKLLICLILILLAGFAYYHSYYLAPNQYQVTEIDYSNKLLPKEFNNFKVGFISDLNIKDESDIERLKDIVASINSQKVDMIIFGGDIFDSQIFDNDKISEVLKEIDSKDGKFAVLGEKDLTHINETTGILNKSGFEVLQNEYRHIYYNNAAIGLFGLVSNGDMNGLVTEQNKDAFKLVIEHEPDYFYQTSNSNIQLQLSGHSLGGYINLPFIGGLIKKDNATKYINGTYHIKDSTLIISNGLANESSFNYRLFCPNEILIVTLLSK